MTLVKWKYIDSYTVVVGKAWRVAEKNKDLPSYEVIIETNWNELLRWAHAVRIAEKADT